MHDDVGTPHEALERLRVPQLGRLEAHPGQGRERDGPGRSGDVGCHDVEATCLAQELDDVRAEEARSTGHDDPTPAHAGILSKRAASPCPPPMHIVSTPYRASRRSISRSRLARIRPPVAPIGWPSEMPEPLTLTRSRSASVSFHSRKQAMTCAANASLISRRSTSAQSMP